MWPWLAPSGREPIEVLEFVELRRLVAARLEEVIVHRAARAGGVARADRLVDPPVRFRRVTQVAVRRALDRAAAAIRSATTDEQITVGTTRRWLRTPTRPSARR